MKKYGKLIIAFMWLGLTMIMIVGATFAWFSENRNVEANGMTVEAEASKNLLISGTGADASDYAISASTSFSGKVTLSPASTTDLSNFFRVVKAKRGTKVNYATGAVTAEADVMESATIATSSSATGEINVAKHTFYIKLEGVSGAQLNNLVVSSLTLQTPANDISNAIRVGVKCGSNVYVYAPNGSTTYQGITSTAAATGAVTNLKANPSNDVLATTITVGSPVTVEVFIWYEGQDPDCISANSIEVETVAVKIAFSASDPA